MELMQVQHKHVQVQCSETRSKMGTFHNNRKNTEIRREVYKRIAVILIVRVIRFFQLYSYYLNNLKQLASFHR